MALSTRMKAGVIGPWCWPGLRFFALYNSTLRRMAFLALRPIGDPGTRRKTFSRAGCSRFGRGDSQIIGGRWSNSMMVLSVPVAKAAILGDSRDCDYTRDPRPLADMQPASQAGCLFVGFDNSVKSGDAKRFGPAT